jgi:hypothetical protein
MSAQPVHEDDPQDPRVILRDLPPVERPEFLRQYRAAVEAARDDVSQYRALQLLLRRWSLVVTSTRQPGYHGAVSDAKAGVGRYVPLDEALAAERARRAS